MQEQLLSAPVEQLADPQHVLRRTGQRVNPTKLFELFAALAKHAEQLPVETELIDAAWPGVGAVEHLVRSRRNADCPWRARREGTGLDLRLSWDVADSWLGVGWHRHVNDDLAQKIAVVVENLDAVIAAIGNLHVALGVGRDRVRGCELAGAVAAVAP